jgi:hypothetical protein
MYVGSITLALRFASVPQLATLTPPAQPSHGRPPLTGSGCGGSTAEKKTTNSPLGARAAMGSCAKAPCTTERRTKGTVSGSGDVAWITIELLSHVLMPQKRPISAAYMWYTPLSSGPTTEPPHDETVSPPTAP